MYRKKRSTRARRRKGLRRRRGVAGLKIGYRM